MYTVSDFHRICTVEFKKRCIFQTCLQHGICTLFDTANRVCRGASRTSFFKNRGTRSRRKKQNRIWNPAHLVKTGYEIPPIYLKPDMKSRPAIQNRTWPPGLWMENSEPTARPQIPIGTGKNFHLSWSWKGLSRMKKFCEPSPKSIQHFNLRFKLGSPCSKPIWAMIKSSTGDTFSHQVVMKQKLVQQWLQA